MKIGIANDHRGVRVKEELMDYLNELGHTVMNYGTNSEGAVDYPDYAFKVGEEVSNKNIDVGVLICATGIGMSIAANKVKGIRCAKVDNVWEAEMTRLDNDANIISLSYKKPIEELKELLNVFISTDLPIEERHVRRISMIDDYK
jgi:ribose 5-phosphate isomerase B